MIIRSFTGPSSLTTDQKEFVKLELENFNKTDLRISGGAYGVDTIVALHTLPHLLQLMLPKDKPFNRELEDLNVPKLYIPGDYRKRNEALVEAGDVLHAFVKNKEFYRSGEWMTVNIARKRGVPVEFHLFP